MINAQKSLRYESKCIGNSVEYNVLLINTLFYFTTLLGVLAYNDAIIRLFYRDTPAKILERNNF